MDISDFKCGHCSYLIKNLLTVVLSWFSRRVEDVNERHEALRESTPKILSKKKLMLVQCQDIKIEKRISRSTY